MSGNRLAVMEEEALVSGFDLPDWKGGVLPPLPASTARLDVREDLRVVAPPSLLVLVQPLPGRLGKARLPRCTVDAAEAVNRIGGRFGTLVVVGVEALDSQGHLL